MLEVTVAFVIPLTDGNVYTMFTHKVPIQEFDVFYDRVPWVLERSDVIRDVLRDMRRGLAFPLEWRR